MDLLLTDLEAARAAVQGEVRGDLGPPAVAPGDVSPEALQQAAIVAQAEAVSAAAVVRCLTRFLFHILYFSMLNEMPEDVLWFSWMESIHSHQHFTEAGSGRLRLLSKFVKQPLAADAPFLIFRASFCVLVFC